MTPKKKPRLEHGFYIIQLLNHSKNKYDCEGFYKSHSEKEKIVVMLDPQERKRYSRQMIMPEIGMAGQEKLKAAKVLVIGAGGLGCPVLQYLVAAGVGTIGVVDDDVIDITNLHRQILYASGDVGQSKARTSIDKLSILNTFVNLRAIAVRLTQENAAMIFADYDLIIDGSDNFPTRYLANDVCLELDKPLVFGSVLRFEGQVSVFNFKGGPTYRCLFPEADEGDNCAVAGVLGVLPGIIGTYMANEAIKVICDIGNVLSGRLMVINALTNETNIFKFDRKTEVLNSNKPDQKNSPTQRNGSKVGEVSLEDFEFMLKTDPNRTLLVDVREEYEFEEDFIGGINVPLPDLRQNLTLMPPDKTIVFYCRSGARSLMAANLLKKNEFKGEIYWMKEPTK